LRSAYGNIDISGKPAWADSDFYDIEAKAANTATVTRAELIEMLHQLLADRFKLKLQRETKEVAGYSLTVAKNGPKMIPAAPDAPKKDTVFDGTPGGAGVLSGRATTAAIAGMLSNLMRLIPVTDDTGLKGEYDYKLTWTPDKNLESWYPEGADGPVASDGSVPSLFTALQDQLGLRLVPKKNVKVDVLVIDSVQKPSLN
jgi:uncharacterized protein (TIGR03435 family)